MSENDSGQSNISEDARFAEAQGTTISVPVQAQSTAQVSLSSRTFLARTGRESVTVRIIPQKSDNTVSEESTS